MSDRLPGSSPHNPIIYKDVWELFLNPNWCSRYDTWCFMHKDYDGPGDNRHGYGSSEQECKDLIDEMYD